MADPRTHLGASPSLVGEPLSIDEGSASARLATSEAMAVDEQGLVHGGFVFGLADYAAMLAVNDPNVVLGAAEARFLKPVSAGQVVVAEALVEASSGRKRIVRASARVDDTVVFEATFTAFVLDRHVLEG